MTVSSQVWGEEWWVVVTILKSG